MNRTRVVFLCIALFTCTLFAHAQQVTNPPAQPLWPEGAPGAKGKAEADIPAIFVHLPPADKATGAAIVICPGGGYGHLSMDREGHDVARWYNERGVAGIVLRYRLGPTYHHPIEMEDAQRALRYVRTHAQEWKIDPAKIGIMGFSAGGHLASTVGTHFDMGDADAKDPIDRQSCRPDFMMLLYPVIRLDGPLAHVGSRTALLGKDPAPGVVESLNNDKHVTAKTPPTFLAHTTADQAVNPENSVQFYLALLKNKVPAELHLYEKGGHGAGLGGNLPFASWTERSIAWMKGHGWLDRKVE